MDVGDGKARTKGGAYVETYGFVYCITFCVLYVLYLLWAYVPACVLQRVGLGAVADELPSRYWALALPSFVCVTVVYVFTGYVALVAGNAEPTQSVHSYTGTPRQVCTQGS
eukprot:TRINITY_DN1366_c0_g4_i1.p2 TRINITY_DN1366_c0_g4~~TRINITY_DN1366_c0_g4_i1.p2  ORF type:complete len:111 (+),score=29.60 TRINITY_DN1366_c0_g4_i1:25-357(+)